VNNDMRVFFSKQNPQLQALEVLENTYTKDDNVIFVIAPKSGDVFTRDTLSAIESLTEAAWQIPYSGRVESITNFQNSRAEGEDLIVEDLVSDSLHLSDVQVERTRRVALSEPLLVNRLVSPTGHVTGINVSVLLPHKSPEEVPEVAAFSRELKETFRKQYAGMEIYLTGTVMFGDGFAEVSKDDMLTLVPVMFLVLIVLTGILLRSWTGAFVNLLVILISMVTGMGIAGWLGMAVNPGSANAPTIILTLAVADSVHILVTLFACMRAGKSKDEAITESMRTNLHPVFLTSVTTAIGFLTMNFSDAPPFRDLGNIVAVGVMAAFFYSVLLLPALVSVLPIRIPWTSRGSDRPPCSGIAEFVERRWRILFWGSLVMVLVLSSGILRIELGDDWKRYFDERYDLRIATDFVSEQLTGINLIEYSLKAGEPGGINDPAFMRMLDDFANWYRGQPEVVHVYCVADIMKRLNKNLHGDDESYYSLPERRELAAQYLLLYEMSLPFGLDLYSHVNVDKSATRMIVNIGDVSTQRLRDIDRRARDWLVRNAPQTMHAQGTGLAMVWAYLSGRNIKNMLWASFGALVLISGILIFALRSPQLGLLSLVPNLAPAAIAFGLWGLAVGQVGLGLSIVVSLTLGIVVDDTVHFLSHYRRARRELALDAPGAVRHSFHTVGTAMWLTTATLVAGFLVLTFSGYKMNAHMGLMSAMTIALALVMDFLFLPTLLLRLGGFRGKRR
jgi:hypothetical protein